MNENEKKDKNEQDPFDFFKLAPESDDPKNSKRKPKVPVWITLLLVVSSIALINILFIPKSNNLVPFSQFRSMIKDGIIQKVDLSDSVYIGYTSVEEKNENNGLFSTPEKDNSIKTFGILTEDFLQLLDEKNVIYYFVPKQNNFLLQLLAQLLVPLGFFLLMWFFVFRKMGSGLGGSIFSAGASKASAVEEGSVKTRFSDVAGVDEAKEELVEVVDFLKSPQKYI